MNENFVRDLMRFTSNLHFAGKSLVLTGLLLRVKFINLQKVRIRQTFTQT